MAVRPLRSLADDEIDTSPMGGEPVVDVEPIDTSDIPDEFSEFPGLKRVDVARMDAHLDIAMKNFSYWNGKDAWGSTEGAEALHGAFFSLAYAGGIAAVSWISNLPMAQKLKRQEMKLKVKELELKEREIELRHQELTYLQSQLPSAAA